ISVSMTLAPGGPVQARYGLWLWLGIGGNPRPLVAHGQTLGCTLNPAPLLRGQTPPPVFCLHGRGIPNSVGGSVRLLGSPPRAPWTVLRNQGLSSRFVFTLQGFLQDAGAGNPTGYSVTNAVVLQVR